eukprot:TRINITY_DN15694_c0_g1_i1.p1 TRINITY_DN15694_c0_g1~~TRINITY_DN15694_c0_g1_i1.p1  ORF type:complete len:394 (+),score=38.32 TRINITY_DN15694_c0_g1_i1:94-1182(+)
MTAAFRSAPMRRGGRESRSRSPDLLPERRRLGGSRTRATIQIAGCPADVTRAEIKEVCLKFGPVIDVDIQYTRRDTTAFVTFASNNSAKAAVYDLRGADLFGCGRIDVSLFDGPGGLSYDARDDGGRHDIIRRNYSVSSFDNGRADGDRRGQNGRARERDHEGQWERGDERMREPGIERRRARTHLSGERSWEGNCLQRQQRPPSKLLDDSEVASEGATASVEAKDADTGKQKSPASRIQKHPADEQKNANGKNNDQSQSQHANGVHAAGNGADAKNNVSKYRQGQVRVNMWQLPVDFEEDELLDMASDYGTVRSYELWSELKQKCAMVEFSERESALAAREGLHNRKMEGWNMNLKLLVCD